VDARQILQRRHAVGGVVVERHPNLAGGVAPKDVERRRAEHEVQLVANTSPDGLHLVR
jgi:hypothetical protein